MKLLFDGMHGLGDNIYQRAFMHHFPGAYVKTPWPEIYQGLNVHCVRTGTTLRTQQKNEQGTDYKFSSIPYAVIRRRIFYGSKELAAGGIIDVFRKQFCIPGPLNFDLPSYNDPHESIPVGRKIAVIRPATVRTEWASASRNPDPAYLVLAAKLLRSAGFFVVSVADIEEGKEDIVGDEPPADLKLHRGELSITQLCDVYERAACVVSPVGFSIPLAIGYGTPLFVVAGGRGGHNAPDIVTDQQMDLSKTVWAIPDKYCMCTQADHDCDKRISNFDNKFNRWLREKVL